MYLATRSGPTEVRRGETVGPPTLLLRAGPARVAEGTKRAGPLQEGGIEPARLLPTCYIPLGAGSKREEISGLSLGWRGFFQGHRRGFLPRYLRCHPQLPSADRGDAGSRQPPFALHAVRPGVEAFGDPL